MCTSLYIIINHGLSHIISYYIILSYITMAYHDHCTWVHNRPSGISHRCLLSQKVLAECVPEMYEAQGVQGGNPLWYIWESNKDKYMIIYVNVGENHHTICSQKSMKHRGYRGRGPFDTFNNPFEPKITHQKLKYHHQQCKVMQSPQYEIKWSWFIICDLPRGISWIRLILWYTKFYQCIPCVHI